MTGRQHGRTPRPRALAERTISKGHLIGNHSATHRIALGELTEDAAVDAEIDDCEHALADVETHGESGHTVMVLHDVDGAALPRLTELLDRLEELGVVFSLELPDDCVAMCAGEPRPALPSH